MSNSVIGALRVNLGLDSAQFTRGARGASSTLRRMRGQFLAVAGVAAALGTALSALTVSVSRTASEISRFSQVANAAPEQFQRWAAAAETVGIEQEKLADVLKDVNDRVGDFLSTGGGPMADFFENIAPRVGITADAFRDLSGPDALQLYVSSLEAAGLSQQEMTFYLEAMASDATALLPLLRNNGEEMARLGQNAADLGAVMSDETVAAMTALRRSLDEAGNAVAGVGFRIAGALAPALTALADAFVEAMQEGGAFRTIIDALAENMDVIVASMGVAVTVFGVRYVGALAVATISTFTLSGALAVLRTALITTGIGALIVGAGYLVAEFARLVEATGSVGAALELLGAVGNEVWARVGLGVVALRFKVQSEWLSIRSAIVTTIANIVDRLAGFSNSVIGTFVGTYEAIIAAWNQLPAAMEALAVRASNALVERMGSAINGIIAAINRIPGFNIADFDVSGFIQTGEDVVGVAQAASEAFSDAFGQDYVGNSSIAEGLREVASNAADASDILGSMGQAATEAATAPLESLAALREALQQTVDTAGGETSAPVEGEAGGPGAASGGGGGGGGDGFAGRLQGLVRSLETEREALDRWYQEQQEILGDQRAIELLGEEEHRAQLLRIEEEYQRRLAEIRSTSQSSTLSDTATFFGALQEVAAAGGQGMARSAAIFGAVQATINSYLAATQALAQPGISLAGRFAAYASVLATGLRGVAAIKAAGGKVGGGGVSTSPSQGGQSAAPLREAQESERRVLIDFGNSPEWVKSMVGDLMEQIYRETENGARISVVQA